jgi:hypothetical protein
MKTARLIANVLFYISRLFAIPYIFTAIHATIAVIFKTSAFWLEKEGSRFIIAYPFTQKRFLLGENDSNYIFEMLAFLGLFGIFLWLLGNVLNIFRQEKLFTIKNLKRLTLFYMFNFIIPPLFLIYNIAINFEIETIVIITFSHFVIGVFAYFMGAIFKQGLNLQKEQDLFI